MKINRAHQATIKLGERSYSGRFYINEDGMGFWWKLQYDMGTLESFHHKNVERALEDARSHGVQLEG